MTTDIAPSKIGSGLSTVVEENVPCALWCDGNAWQEMPSQEQVEQVRPRMVFRDVSGATETVPSMHFIMLGV